eukprot:TRINITY_DN3153_c0_g1_i3.p1 TRINITY_DN3153_c0_g1~~TRINITY_DN3153_c0_g1_i3.p1  ORF type:complete len:165 (-),score=28.02 TRINITY_DN3153_c0_g1_i3:30-524(-)
MGGFHLAGLSQGETHWVNEKVRGDYILWLNDIHDAEWTYYQHTTLLRQLVDSILDIQQQLNNGCHFDSHQTQIQVTKYPPGASYVRHLDAFEGGSTRRITCLYYINPTWEQGDGGELRIFNEEDDSVTDIAPIGDRLLVFQSRTLEHEVRRTHKNRYAVTIWFY